MDKRSVIRLMLFGSIGSSLLGLPYVCKLFEVNAGVIQWGILSVFIGLVLLCSTVAWDNLTDKTAKYLLAFEFSLLSIIQLVPIYYWFIAHSKTVSVSTFNKAISHFGYTVPHFLLLFIGVLVVYRLLNKDMLPKLNRG